jgi:Putative Flp pilus-assembly TadE/G-like
MIRPARRRTASDDRGAYAVLYAFLVMALIGAGALVVDLSLMRESRATNRSATDSAATAAAARLNALDPAASNPQSACETAWEYLLASIPDLPDGQGSCGSLPTTATACITAPAEATVAPSLPDGWDVRITWPVVDGSALLHHPDVFGSNPTQTPDPDFDGSEVEDVCARIGVEVYQANDILLGAALEFSGTVDTRAASVARNTATGGDSTVVAAMNVLEPNECAALEASGTGDLLVEGTGNRSGVIAVESSGDGCASGDYTIRTSAGISAIRATGPGGVPGGAIQSYALAVGNSDRVAPDDGSVSPPPTPLPLQSGAEPVLNVFGCSGSPCGDGGGPWLSDLTDALGSGNPPSPYPGADSPWDVADFETLPGSELPDFACDASDAIVVPAGNWYIDCSGDGDVLRVSENLVFEGGTIVTSGAVEVVDGGCLAVNVTISSPTAACSSINPESPSLDDAFLYVRDGSLTKEPNASLILRQALTYLDDGAIDLASGSGEVFLTHPRAQDCVDPGAATCRAQRFNPVVLWSESTTDHRIEADDDLVLRGIVFTPEASFEFSGTGGAALLEAQFWTRRLENEGDTDIVIRSDPGASIPRPAPGVSLIR